MEKRLHIICLDIPYPVEHGAHYDLFFKLRALHAQQVKIFLHCFYKKREPQNELKQYCEKVYYYKRNTGYKGISLKYPYIVASRNNENLLNRLLQDDYPILMEGIHCTFLTNDERFKNRTKIVRLHNVEHIYYKQLYACSQSLGKKIYYFTESRLLAKYEKKLVKNVTAFWAVSDSDVTFYQEEFKNNNIRLLPLFLPEWKVKGEEGLGTFCLYHGNLSVEENEYAAIRLIKKVFSEIKIPFVIAGKNPSKNLEKIIYKYKHCCLVANPSEAEMSDIIKKAQIHVLPSYNYTGIKLKLLNALYNGRHCITNKAAANYPGFSEICNTAEEVEELKQKIQQLFIMPFKKIDIQKREQILIALFNNELNARKIVQWLWE